MNVLRHVLGASYAESIHGTGSIIPTLPCGPWRQICEAAVDAVNNTPSAARWQRVSRDNRELEDAIAKLAELLGEDAEK